MKMEVPNTEIDNKLNTENNITMPQVSSEPASTTETNEVHRSHSVLMNDEKKDRVLNNFMGKGTVDFITKVLAEFICTGLLLFLGCMGCVTGLLKDDSGSHFNASIGFGLVVMIGIQIFGCISGAHMNPSVTVAALIYNLISLPLAVAYIIAQVLGACTGFGLLKLLSPVSLAATNETAGMCTTRLHDAMTPAQGFFIEFVITGVLILVNCGVWDPRNVTNTDSIPLRFGFTIVGISLVAGPFTGASMNPVRSLGPAIWNGYFKHHWIYWVAPLSAAVIVTFIFKLVFRREVQESLSTPSEETPLNRKDSVQK